MIVAIIVPLGSFKVQLQLGKSPVFVGPHFVLRPIGELIQGQNVGVGIAKILLRVVLFDILFIFVVEVASGMVLSMRSNLSVIVSAEFVVMSVPLMGEW